MVQSGAFQYRPDGIAIGGKCESAGSNKRQEDMLKESPLDRADHGFALPGYSAPRLPMGVSCHGYAAARLQATRLRAYEPTSLGSARAARRFETLGAAQLRPVSVVDKSNVVQWTSGCVLCISPYRRSRARMTGRAGLAPVGGGERNGESGG
jgi:hypothetical protein